MPGRSNYYDKKPIFDPPPGKVVIEITNEEEWYGHIIMPATSRETRTIGIVHTTFKPGFDENEVPWEPWCCVGDIVIIGKYTGTEVTIAQRKYVILQEKDILSKLSFEDVEPKTDSVP